MTQLEAKIQDKEEIINDYIKKMKEHSGIVDRKDVEIKELENTIQTLKSV